MPDQEEQQTDEEAPQSEEATPGGDGGGPQAGDSQQSDEDLVAAIPPRDGSANDPVANAEASLADVNMDEQREALKKIQKDLPSAG